MNRLTDSSADSADSADSTDSTESRQLDRYSRYTRRSLQIRQDPARPAFISSGTREISVFFAEHFSAYESHRIHRTDNKLPGQTGTSAPCPFAALYQISLPPIEQSRRRRRMRKVTLCAREITQIRIMLTPCLGCTDAE